MIIFREFRCRYANEFLFNAEFHFCAIFKVPSGAPANVSNIPTTAAGQLVFTWEEPDCGSRRGKIVQYDYNIGVYSEAGLYTEWTINGSTPGTIVIFNDLPVNTQFQFRVRALTSAGSGPFSNHMTSWTSKQNPKSKLEQYMLTRMQYKVMKIIDYYFITTLSPIFDYLLVPAQYID